MVIHSEPYCTPKNFDGAQKLSQLCTVIALFAVTFALKVLAPFQHTAGILVVAYRLHNPNGLRGGVSIKQRRIRKQSDLGRIMEVTITAAGLTAVARTREVAVPLKDLLPRDGIAAPAFRMVLRAGEDVTGVVAGGDAATFSFSSEAYTCVASCRPGLFSLKQPI